MLVIRGMVNGSAIHNFRNQNVIRVCNKKLICYAETKLNPYEEYEKSFNSWQSETIFLASCTNLMQINYGRTALLQSTGEPAGKVVDGT